MTTLDELRRANLREQRRKAEAAADQQTVESDAPQTPAAHLNVTSKPVTPAIRPEIEAISTPAHANGNGHSPAVEPTVPPVTTQTVDDPTSSASATAEPEHASRTSPTEPVAPAGDETDRKARAILDRFYRGLAHKVVHPTGVKATVDMPPELFWRVKRYCHDHNNVTVRQLFLDLVIALLDEEGY